MADDEKRKILDEKQPTSDQTSAVDHTSSVELEEIPQHKESFVTQAARGALPRQFSGSKMMGLFADTSYRASKKEEEKDKQEIDPLAKRQHEGESADFDSLEHRLLALKLASQGPKVLRVRESVLVSLRFLIAGIIGIAAGLVAYLSALCYRFLIRQTYLNLMSYYLLTNDHQLAGYFLPLLLNLLYGFIAASLVLWFGWETKGAGVDRLQAYLSGMHFFDYTLLSPKSLLVKNLGLIFAVSAGIKVGAAGPYIHIGSIVGYNVREMVTWVLFKIGGIATIMGQILSQIVEEREFISCGSAAGFTVAFNAPIAGVVLIQAGGNFFSGSLILRMFFSTFTAASTLSWLNSDGFVEPWRGVVDSQSSSEPFHFDQLFACVVMGLFGGVLSTAYTKINLWILKYRLSLSGKRPLPNYIDVLCCVYFTFSIAFICSYFSECEINPPLCAKNPARCVRFQCPQGQHSVLATFLFTLPEQLVRILFDQTPDHQERHNLEAGVLTAYLVLYFVMSSISYNCAVPGGIFGPSIIMGATMGRIVGIFWNKVIGYQGLNGGLYATLGAAAMLGGMTRFTLPVSVYMMEITNDSQLVIPIMAVVFIGKMFSDTFVGGLYPETLRMEGIVLAFGDFPNPVLRLITAREVMSHPPLHTISLIDTVKNAYRLIKATNHNSFPVIVSNNQPPSAAPSETDKLTVDLAPTHPRSYIGLLHRHHLAVLLTFPQRWYKSYEAALQNPVVPDLDTPNTSDDEGGTLSRGIKQKLNKFFSDSEDETGSKKKKIRKKKKKPTIPEKDEEEGGDGPEKIKEFSEDEEISLQAPQPKRRKRKVSKQEAKLRDDLKQYGKTVGAEDEFEWEERTVGVEEIDKFMDATSEHAKYWLNLSPFIDRGAYLVGPECPGDRIWRMFARLGMRHIVVVDHSRGGEPIGIITRQDIILASKGYFMD